MLFLFLLLLCIFPFHFVVPFGIGHCHGTLSYYEYSRPFDPRVQDLCWGPDNCVESSCSFEIAGKSWTKVSKGCTFNGTKQCVRLEQKCLKEGGKPLGDCSFCNSVLNSNCNNKIPSEIVVCLNGTVNNGEENDEEFTEIRCEDASCFSVRCVGTDNSTLFHTKGCVNMDKLWAVKLPLEEFGRKECQAMNGTTEHNSCNGNRCNARNEKQSSSEATTTRSAEAESRVITSAETVAVSYDGTKKNTSTDSNSVPDSAKAVIMSDFAFAISTICLLITVHLLAQAS